MLIREATVASLLPNGRLATNVQFQVARLLIVFEWSANLPASMDAVFNFLSGIDCSIAYVAQGSTHRHSHEIPLSVFAQFDSSAEGSILVNQNAAATINKVIVPVMMSPEGALNNKGNDQFQIEFSDIPSTGDFTVALYGMESPLATPALLQYHTLTIESDKRQDGFALHQYNSIAVNPASLTELELEYSNGRDVRFTPEELRYLAHSTNDVVAVGSTGAHPVMALSGLYDHVIIDVSAVTGLKIYKNAGAPCHIYGEKTTIVRKVQEAQQVNAGFQDTTAEHILKDINN